MSKRLILVLAVAFVLSVACGAYAEVQNVKVSGDITAYGIIRNLTLKDSKAGGNSWDKDLATITRVRVDADLTDNVIATVRLLNERYWGNETDNVGTTNAHNTEIDLDLAYVTLKEFLYSPLTLTVGRQELHFGNEMIVGDPDTNNQVSTASAFSGRDADLSARKSFDAIRLTLNYDPLIVDILGAKIRENTVNLNDDTDLYGINANYALSNRTTLEGYFFSKNTGLKASGEANKYDRVHTLGARMVTQPIDNLTYQLEGAYQFGRYEPALATPRAAQRSAFAIETALTYDMKDRRYAPSITALYAFFSGDKGNNKTYRGWDPMYENQKFGDIANALFNQSNAHIAGLVGSVRPVEDVTLKGEYYAYWWDKSYGDGQVIQTVRNPTTANLTTKHRKFAGQEIDVTATYDYTEDVQFALLGGVLFPGASFADGSNNMASELIGSMKVTF